jgi:hypothetical protein
MSKRPSVIASRASPRPVTAATPESPGPPGLRTANRSAGQAADHRQADARSTGMPPVQRPGSPWQASGLQSARP